jgi:hypothetical protein
MSKFKSYNVVELIKAVDRKFRQRKEVAYRFSGDRVFYNKRKDGAIKP